jgi:hypothetical protein
VVAFGLAQGLGKNSRAVRSVSPDKSVAEAIANLRRAAKNLLFDEGDELIPGGLSAFQVTRPFFAQLFGGGILTRAMISLMKDSRAAVPDPVGSGRKRSNLIWIGCKGDSRWRKRFCNRCDWLRRS